MKTEAEQGQRRLEIVVSAGGGGWLHEDVLGLILSRLPLKPLFRFKTVSKSWRLLIETLNLPPPLFLGFFYMSFCQGPPYDDDDDIFPRIPLGGIFRYIVGGGTNAGIDNNYGTIDPYLSFLPFSTKANIRSLNVTDCCNGLLLFKRNRDNTRSHYVCNPLTKSWTQLLYNLKCVSRLDFDPKVSPHFKIVTFTFHGCVGTKKPKLEIHVISSPTMTWKSYKPVRLLDPYYDDCYMMSMYQHVALWEGSLYLLFGRNCLSFRNVGRIVRFDLLENHVAERGTIEFPTGTNKPKRVGIGRLRNKLCLAGLDWVNNDNPPHQQKKNMVLRLRVWSLSSRDQTVWVLEHDSIITPSSHLLCGGQKASLSKESTYIGQFHPFLDVVFILSKSMVYAYNMKNLSLNEVCHIHDDTWEVDLASVFPFLPSSVHLQYST